MKLSQRTIEEVQNRISIEEVVSDFVNLKKRGQNLIACCPFHDEKTPSFSVSPSKGIYKCFGCGKGGDAISFIMEIEGVTYPEAIKHLAQKYGIEIVEEGQMDNEDLARQNERDSLLIVLNYAKEYFKKILWEHEEGMTIGLSYFKERGFDHQAIRKFDLGFGIEKWDGFYQEAIKSGYSPEILEKAGLIVRKEGKTYDRFRGRTIFPIHNVSGKVIAFGARILKQGQQPKYLNSPETEVYHKSKILYGMHLAKQAIRQLDNCYLVEGYTDVISLHMADVENVAASSGTSLTEDQIRLISRYTKNITVLYDGDSAGIKASLRGIDMILESGMNVKAVVFPEGEDPDSYSRKVGSSEFREYLKNNAVDFIVFKVNLFSKEAAADPIKKAETIRDIVTSIAKIPDPIKRSVYIGECSRILEMDEAVLISEQNKILIKTSRDKQKTQTEVSTPEAPLSIPEREPALNAEDMITWQERESIRLLLNFGTNKMEEEASLCSYLLKELDDVQFISPIYKEIFEIFKDGLANNQCIDSTYMMRYGPEHLRQVVVDLISEKYEISENWANRYKIFVPTEEENLKNLALTNVLRLKLRVMRKMIQENMDKLKQAETNEEQNHFLMVHQELKKLEMELARSLGIVVIR